MPTTQDPRVPDAARPVRRVPGTPVRRAHDRGSRWSYVLTAPAVLGMLHLLLYPLARAVLISLQDFRLRQLVLGDADFVGLRNYRTLLTDPRFWEVVRRTALAVPHATPPPPTTAPARAPTSV